MAIVVEYTLTNTDALTRSQVIEAMKVALRKLGEFWHAIFAPERFKEDAHTYYGFRQRSAKYNRAKLRHHGHTNPLELTGEGKEQTLSASTVARIRVTRDKVTIPLPTKFNRYNPAGPNMAEEIRAVSAEELMILEEQLVAFINDAFYQFVPPQLRRRGELGARVESLQLSVFGTRGAGRGPHHNPLAQRRAA